MTINVFEDEMIDAAAYGPDDDMPDDDDMTEFYAALAAQAAELDCPFCGGDLERDGAAFVCDECEVTWPDENTVRADHDADPHAGEWGQ